MSAGVIMPAGSAARTRAEEEEELFGPDEWVSSSVAGTVSGANVTVFGSDVRNPRARRGKWNIAEEEKISVFRKN